MIVVAYASCNPKDPKTKTLAIANKIPILHKETLEQMLKFHTNFKSLVILAGKFCQSILIFKSSKGTKEINSRLFVVGCQRDYES